uniref:Uncharacterized protein n=1 Tax=Arion vulgaris TaxID=1028688 RepID=A0A0B7B287_9EUPU
MNRMKPQELKGMSFYHERLEHWTTKEMQLNVLHEEIINKREAFLGTTRSILHNKTREESQLSNQDAAARNDKLIKDIHYLEDYLTDRQQEPITHRIANLHANYKSMVENMFPIWQKSMEELQSRPGVTRGDK